MSSKNFGVTLIRGPGKSIPDDYLKKVLEANQKSLGFAVATTDKRSIVVRKHVGKISFEDAKAFFGHGALANRQLVINFGGGVNPINEHDAQPYTVLDEEIEIDGKKTRRPVLVAFLNGDFSIYSQQESVTPPELFCVEKDLIPRVQRAYKYAGGDLTKTMDELNEDINLRDFSNFMIGDHGTITLMAATGQVVSVSVPTDELTKEFDGWWTTNHMEGEPVTETETMPSNDEGLDELERELGGGAPATPKVPEQKKETKTNATVPKPPQGNKKPAAVARPVASTTPVVPSGAAGTGGDAVRAHVPSPSEALNDPEAVLSINVPSNMKLQKKVKWIGHRMPENMVPKTVSGLTKISMKRKEANAAFIQTYCEQNKLDPREALKSLELNGASTLIPASSGVPKVATPAKQEHGYPERAEDKQPDPKPVVEPSKKKDDGPAVVTEPLPVFSPTQKDELLTFVNHESTKAAVDRFGKLIEAPNGREQYERKVESFAQQFGGKLTLGTIAQWPLETFLAYAKHDPNACAKIAFCLAFEHAKMSEMLDELTGPFNKSAGDGKVEEETKTEIVTQKKPSMPSAMPKRRTA